MTRHKDTIESLERRREAWRAEIGTNSEYAEMASRIVAELDEEIAATRQALGSTDNVPNS